MQHDLKSKAAASRRTPYGVRSRRAGIDLDFHAACITLVFPAHFGS
jgi:hypothetical protein